MSESRTLRAVIVDDEPLARQLLLEYITAYPEIEVIAECQNGFEAVKTVAEKKPDLLFLDIQMPKLDGFEVLQLIDHDLAVVFITAFDEYAVRAFEVHAADYLLKPFSEERFGEAVARAKERLATRRRDDLDALASDVAKERLDRVLIRDGAKIHVIDCDKLDYVEAQDDYVAFHTEGKSLLKQQSMADVESQLDPKKFVRIHRSYILNVSRLSRLELYAKDSHVAILATGKQLPVSRAGYARLRSLIG